MSAHDKTVGITAEGVSVHLPVFTINSLSLKKNLIRVGSGGRIHSGSRAVTVEALREVNFTLEDGDRVGVVGLNGAGKTTLLRTLAGVYTPTTGKLSVRGTVVPMLVSGIGMYEDASGFENIRNCALQLGMPLAEIDAKIDEIAEFTELGDYLALPIYSYSAGMRTRLSFAVSTAMEGDILVMDEVIGAGDAAFMRKAEKRFDQLLSRARILVIASHNDQWVREACNKVILLAEGRLVQVGPVDEVLLRYHEMIVGASA